MAEQVRRETKAGLPEKPRAEIEWWLSVFIPRIRERGWWDRPGILGPDDWNRPTYKVAREKEAAGQVLRVLRIAGVPDDFFDGKVVVEIGPGPLGMLEMSRAGTKYAVDPLADEYRKHGLLLEGDYGVTYFSQGAERIPLASECADVVVAFNSLDHVDDVEAVAREINRILTPGGALLLNVELDHPPTPTEPFTIGESDIARMFRGFSRLYYRVVPPYEVETADPELSHGAKWLRACLVKPA
jgi:SAM-dependent methyltransferase